MSTAAIIALKESLEEAEAEYEQQKSDSREAIELGRRAQTVLDARRHTRDEIVEAIRVLEQAENDKQHKRVVEQ